jgi:3-hydroxyisobutyrate dehydrogenase-like beta-hydroxyacid dehydrogenase
MATVGFLGLGSMGKAMAARLIDAGHTVVVWNRSPEPALELQQLGAVVASSPVEALATGASFSMLANDAAAEAVLSGDNFSAAQGFHANMASVSPECATRLADSAHRNGVHYIASPVLGRPPMAAAGKLNILAAGPTEAIALAQPFYDIMGVKTWHMGDTPHTANLVKVAVNYNIIHALQALGESIALVERNGVNAENFVELLTSTLFGGVVYQGYGNIIATKQYSPAGFTLDLGLKDLGLAQSAAEAAGVTLPTAPAIREVFNEALSRKELNGFDWAAIAEVMRES